MCLRNILFFVTVCKSMCFPPAVPSAIQLHTGRCSSPIQTGEIDKGEEEAPRLPGGAQPCWQRSFRVGVPPALPPHPGPPAAAPRPPEDPGARSPPLCGLEGVDQACRVLRLQGAGQQAGERCSWLGNGIHGPVCLCVLRGVTLHRPARPLLAAAAAAAAEGWAALGGLQNTGLSGWKRRCEGLLHPPKSEGEG